MRNDREEKEVKKKLKKFYCDDEMTIEHRCGQWMKKEDCGWYCIYAKRCELCNKVLGEKVVK
jgi:hypothetical protein